VVIKLGKIKQKTISIPENLHPEYHLHFSFPHPGGKPPADIEVAVKSDNIVQKNVSLGTVKVDTSKLTADTPVTAWHKLTGVDSGEVQLTVNYLPNELGHAVHKAGVIDKMGHTVSTKVKQTAGKTSRKLSRSLFILMISATTDMVNRMKEKGYEGSASCSSSFINSSLSMSVATKDSKLFGAEIKDEKEKEDIGLAQKAVNAMIDQLIGGLETASLETKRLGALGEIKISVSGGLPLPFPPVLSFGVGMKVVTDSIFGALKKKVDEQKIPTKDDHGEKSDTF